MPAKAVCVIKGDVNGTIYFDQAVSGYCAYISQ